MNEHEPALWYKGIHMGLVPFLDVADLELSVRAQEILKEAGIKSFHQLERANGYELAHLPGMNRKVWDEITFKTEYPAHPGLNQALLAKEALICAAYDAQADACYEEPADA